MGKSVIIHDSLQNGYSYQLSEPIGQNFADDFLPELTPKQMLELGVFGGHYFEGEQDEFPRDWFVAGRLSDEHDPHMNYFDIDASQSREEWQRKGWIYDDDPRGWFQWYCRYYLGRRIPTEDARQIKRWRHFERSLG